MSSQFIKVKSIGGDKGRGLIAVDAICSAFEDSKRKKVSIMTMDGFWYDVEESIEEIYAKIEGIVIPPNTPTISKAEYAKAKRFSSATLERAPVSHDEVVAAEKAEKRFLRTERNETEDGKTKESRFLSKPKQTGKRFCKTKDFSTGVEEGQKTDEIAKTE